MVKVGLIGLGFMGYTHYQIHKANKKVKFVALADSNKAKLKGDWSTVGGNLGSMKRENEDLTGVATYADPMDLINDPNVDMVDICLPTDLHVKYALAAIKAGKHVFLEKPMSRTAKEGEKLAKAAAKAKTAFMVGHCIRFWPEYEYAYQLVKSGKLGAIREVFLRRVAQPPMGHRGWFMDGKRSGGAALDLHIHDVDFALYLMGMPKKVWAWGDKGPSGAIDVVHAGWEYAKGAHVTIHGGWAYHTPFEFNMEFYIRCEKGTIAYDMSSKDNNPLKVYLGKKKIEPKMAEGTGWGRELAYFVDCIEKGKKPSVITAASSLESVQMVETELASIKSGKAIACK